MMKIPVMVAIPADATADDLRRLISELHADEAEGYDITFALLEAESRLEGLLEHQAKLAADGATPEGDSSSWSPS